jgi:hypothetical protein
MKLTLLIWLFIILICFLEVYLTEITDEDENNYY